MINKSAIKMLVNKAHQFPALSHIYDLQMDRLMMTSGEPSLTFASGEWSQDCLADLERAGLSDVMEIKESSQKEENAIFTAESLGKKGKRTEAITYAFDHATGPQVNALNLFYANHISKGPISRLHYLNKYLSVYGLKVSLNGKTNTDFFQSLNIVHNHAKVEGPLVTIIMPAHNAEATIELAVNSLLNQSWQNLQLIIVDDASTDGTFKKAKALSKKDKRVQVLNSPVNVGPYVCRNLGLMQTQGQWVTVHDADDIAFADRIEQQVNALENTKYAACAGGMLRMNAHGQITRPSKLGPISADGYLRRCFASLFIETEVFRNKLGAWDSVWVAGDSELLDRIKTIGIKFTHLARPLMICLDNPSGLINNPVLGLLDNNGNKNEIRGAYKKAYQAWHVSTDGKKLEMYVPQRRFEVPVGIAVDLSAVLLATEPDMSNPKRVLRNASQLAKWGDHDRAISLAQTHLPPNLAYTAEVLLANAALDNGNLNDWEWHLNEYLSHLKISPIRLEGIGTVFDRLSSDALPQVSGGPLVSVIMAVWNSERTVRKAANSILNQTWRNLELIIVDDASTDGTWAILKEIEGSDNRVRLLSNKVNVGPYVSKNIALSHAKGEWITGHDADDWAMPQRIERHLYEAIQKGFDASISNMIRICPRGQITHLRGVTSFSFDSVARTASISCLFRSSTLHKNLGFWDSVRFGADSEMIARAERILGNRFGAIPQVGMVCLDLENSLTNHPLYGVGNNGLSNVRSTYKDSWVAWHERNLRPDSAFLPLLQAERRYYAPSCMVIPTAKIELNLAR